MRFTSFLWLGCFVNRMQVAFEPSNPVSFMHQSFIFLLPSRARWKFFVQQHKTTVGVLEVPLDWNRRRSWRKAFIAFYQLLPSCTEKVKATVSSAKYKEVFFLSSNTMQHEKEAFLNWNREGASSIKKENANGGNEAQIWVGSLFCV